MNLKQSTILQKQKVTVAW